MRQAFPSADDCTLAPVLKTRTAFGFTRVFVRAYCTDANAATAQAVAAAEIH